MTEPQWKTRKRNWDISSDMSTANQNEALRLLTPAELAEKLNTTPQTVNTWHRTGVIPAKIAIGRIIRFELETVLLALEAKSRKSALQ